MRFRHLNAPHATGKINVTPMIDVVMCLIVFYLIVGKLAADQRSNIRLPVSSTGLSDKAQNHLVINVMPGPPGDPPRIVIDAADIPLDQLTQTIKDRTAAKSDTVVELRGSRDLAYGSVAQIIRACKDAGVGSVRLAAEKPL
jgi:biopolymer transport protein ExbD